jgi:aryl-alcohol dehydrogenase-like predicted oxidoreductase
VYILDPDTPMEEIVRAFNWCIDKGMALYWGTSEWPAHLIAEAVNVADKLRLIAPITEVKKKQWKEEKPFIFLTFLFLSLLNITC